MNYFKDQSGDFHGLSDADIANGGEKFLPIGCVPVSESTAIPSKTKAQLKSAELSVLTAEFQANKHTLNVAWLAAAVADGINEVERKDQVTADIEELQLQYAADVAAIKAKYA